MTTRTLLLASAAFWCGVAANAQPIIAPSTSGGSTAAATSTTAGTVPNLGGANGAALLDSNGLLSNYIGTTTGKVADGGTVTTAQNAIRSVQVPIPGLVQTFDYLPSRDGLGLLTGGPTQAGYAANAATRPISLLGTGGTSGFFEPRNQAQANSNTAAGGSDTYNGLYSYNVDPAYSGFAGFSPFSIVNGNLVITGQTTASIPSGAQSSVPTNPNTSAQYSYVSGVLTTLDTFSQQGGYWEITAKTTTGASMWPAFWLFPTNNSHPPEVDILEQVGGYDPSTTYRFTGISVSSGATQQSGLNSADLGAGFHRYGVYATDQTLQFYFDGMPIGAPVSLATHPEFQTPMYLLLSQQIGSTLANWVTAPSSSTPNPSTLTISHIGVWQAPGPIGVNLSAASYLDSLAVGGTVAAITAPTFGATSGALTYTKVSDPDGMFTISGSNLTLAQSVPATTKSSHVVTIQVADSTGRTRQRTFTISVIAATPTQANYLTSQNLQNGFWSNNGLTIPTSDTVLETATTGQHEVYAASTITRTAGVKTFQTWVELTANAGRPEDQIQIFDGSYANSCFAWFNVTAGTIDDTQCTGSAGWTISNPFLTVLPSGRTRVGFKMTVDASTTGFQFANSIAPNTTVNFNYPGVTTDGMQIDNPWLYNVNAAAGGS